MKNTIFIAVFTVISASMISCSYDENEIQPKQTPEIYELNELDNNNLYSKDGDSIFIGEPIPPKPKG